MIQKPGSSNGVPHPRRFTFYSLTALAILFLYSCASRVQLPSYSEFVQARQSVLPPSVVEVYGRYSAKASGKTFRSSFNMLLNPGKAGYLEILGASGQMLNAISLDPQELTLLWAGDDSYIQEPSSSANINAVIGLPMLPDDLLMAIGGYGLNFSEWHPSGEEKQGWILERENSQTRLTMKEHISRIRIRTSDNPEAVIQYEDYRMTDNRLIPHKIRAEVPDRRIALELRIEKILFRDQPGTSDLFDVQLPANARRLTMKEIYHGKPLLMEQ
jgi:hypothetical protein